MMRALWMSVSGPDEGGRQHPEGRHRQTEVSDCGVSGGAEESDGEDEGECQEHQELHCESEKQTEVLPLKAAVL